MRKLNLTTFLLFSLILIAFMTIAFLAGTYTAKAGSGDGESGSMLNQLRLIARGNLVDQTIKQLKRFYFMEIDDEAEEQLIHGAISGLMNELRNDPFNDEFSHFYDEELFEDLQAQTTGEYAGIGILMGMSADGMYPEVMAVFEDTPAEEAGVVEHDIITEINGEDAFGMYLPEVASMIRGEPGTTVDMSVYRTEDNEFFDFTIERRNVDYSSISNVEMLDGKTGFIEISTFASDTSADFAAAMDDLLEQDMKVLVLDLRGNTGGLFNAAFEVADMFISNNMLAEGSERPGLIVEVEQRIEGTQQRQALFATQTQPRFSLPIVVLVGPSTASASEILTGALQDYGLATVVGETTFGKGVVQAVNPLEGEGDEATSALAITIGKYYTPSGQDLHRIGIEPDIWYGWEYQVEEDEQLSAMNDEIEKMRDELMLKRANARKYIREHDLVRDRGLEVAGKLLAGEEVPDVEKPAEDDDEHMPLEASMGVVEE